MSLESKMQLIADKEEIRDQLYRWCRGVGRKDWDLVRSIFHPNAQDRHGHYNGSVDEFLEWQRCHHASIDQSAHLLSNVLIEFAGPDIALVESYVVEYQSYPLEAQSARVAVLGEEASKTIGAFSVRGVGRYLDRFQRADGAWKISHRTTVFETFRIDQGGRNLQPHWISAQRDETDELVRLREELRAK
jgi:hypothetical protein